MLCCGSLQVTFATEDLHTNFGALGAAIMRARPPGLKGSGLSGASAQ